LILRWNGYREGIKPERIEQDDGQIHRDGRHGRN
jgi:hypothetical protein